MEQIRRTETDGDPPPEGYLSVEAFVAERHQEFPVLHEAPSPAPIEGSGRLVEIYRYWPAGTGADSSVNALALRLERSPGPALRAYLDLPVKPELLEHLRSLSRRDSVTVSGIGHGSGTGVINIYRGSFVQWPRALTACSPTSWSTRRARPGAFRSARARVDSVGGTMAVTPDLRRAPA